MCCQLTCSSASTLLFRSFISSFISLGGPEKVTKKRSVSKSPLPEVGRDIAAGLRPSSAAFHSPPSEPPGSATLGPAPGASIGSNACCKYWHLILLLEYLQQSGEFFRQWSDASRIRCLVKPCAHVVILISTRVCPVPWQAQRFVPAEGPGQGIKALPGVSRVMPVLATAHYYSRYEFEVSQRVPKVIMDRHQQRPPLLVAPDLPCGKDDDGENSCIPATTRHGWALSPSQMEQWLDLCTGRLFGWQRESQVTGNKGEACWLLSPLLSLASPAPATLRC